MKDTKQYRGTMTALWILRAEEALELGFFLVFMGFDRICSRIVTGSGQIWRQLSVRIRRRSVRSRVLLQRLIRRSVYQVHLKASTLRIMVLQTAVLAVLFLMLSSLVFGIVYTVSARDQKSYTKYITCITIEDGDSLWRIAERYYSDAYQDIPSFIEEIRFCNNLYGDEIHAGEKLLIPYFVPVSDRSRAGEESSLTDTPVETSTELPVEIPYLQTGTP